MKDPINPRTLSDQRLADRAGALNVRMATLEAELNKLEAEFMRRQFLVVDGKHFRLSYVDEFSTQVLDTAAIKATMPQLWIEQNSKDKHTRASCRISAVTGVRHLKPVPLAAPEPPAPKPTAKKTTSRALALVE